MDQELTDQAQTRALELVRASLDGVSAMLNMSVRDLINGDEDLLNVVVQVLATALGLAAEVMSDGSLSMREAMAEFMIKRVEINVIPPEGD